jgi:hypothetical protein
MALEQNAVITFLYTCPRGATLDLLVVQFGCPEQKMTKTLNRLRRRGILDYFDSMEVNEDGVMRWCINADWRHSDGYGYRLPLKKLPGDSQNSVRHISLGGRRLDSWLALSPLDGKQRRQSIRGAMGPRVADHGPVQQDRESRRFGSRALVRHSYDETAAYLLQGTAVFLLRRARPNHRGGLHL